MCCCRSWLFISVNDHFKLSFLNNCLDFLKGEKAKVPQPGEIGYSICYLDAVNV